MKCSEGNSDSWKQIFDGIGVVNVTWPKNSVSLTASVGAPDPELNNNLDKSRPDIVKVIPSTQIALNTPHPVNAFALDSTPTMGLISAGAASSILTTGQNVSLPISIGPSSSSGSPGASMREREYKCYFCDKSFARRYRRDTHVR